jgi:2',3'-cyclic-nucleotide 2'-phosphodiesterase (5'-nucleotidase family)
MTTLIALRIIHRFCTLLLSVVLLHCAPTTSTALEPHSKLHPVDSSYETDSLAEATIAPFRTLMRQQMEVVIGHANKRLVKGNVESLLGNFVTDAILFQSKLNYSGKVHMSVTTNGGLRAPIPKGPVTVSTIYELMPFENQLYILELNSDQTNALFDLLASNKKVSIANSVVLVEDDKPMKIFIDGEPFSEDQAYILAVADYYAQGGGGMDFLKEARVLAKIDVKIRDMIIEHIRWLEAQGSAADAEIEGRVKLIP